MNKVYMAMSADFLHSGHLHILDCARKLGSVTIGILTDQAIATFKRTPLLKLEQRKIIIENLKGVDNIIIQETLSYKENLLKLKPDYVVHGDDWQDGVQKNIREEVLELLKGWKGELIEPPTSSSLSSAQLSNEFRKRNTTPDTRKNSLRRLLKIKPLLRILEVHNGLTGLIAENTSVSVNNQFREFDGMWESSLTDSTSKGKPDTQAVDITSRILTIDQILDVTSKPMIVDADNGGLIEHFRYTIKTLERLGVSAVIIEDKIGAKKNSLFGTDVDQTQDSIEDFSLKITEGKKIQSSKGFMIIARIESLILKKGMEDAIERSKAYVESGADGIMIHSKEKKPDEIIEFIRTFRAFNKNTPLIVVPSTYAQISEQDLNKEGVNIVIYANHLLRSAFPAMKETAKSILTHERCKEASDQHCMPIKEILTLIPN
jgi:phosphoenolpyruvate phosphomutase / 2-hydroxyethylphosphonate cytidylyltransferase